MKQRAVLGTLDRARQGKQRVTHYFCGLGSKKAVRNKTDPISSSVSKNWWEGAVSVCLQSVSMNICLCNWSLRLSNIVLGILHELFYLFFITVSGNIRMYFYCSYVMNEFAKTPELAKTPEISEREGPILTLQFKLLQKFQEGERLLGWRLREERGVGEREIISLQIYKNKEDKDAFRD